MCLTHNRFSMQMLHSGLSESRCSQCHWCSECTHFAHTYWFASGLRNPRGLALERETRPTVVVLTRPPGCVQVHPDLLTKRSQPSSSKHGTISHHCFFRTMPAAEKHRKRERKKRRLERLGEIRGE